eukprot:Skav206154  [mRNA]  locus=scaffold1545:135052:136056:- [translate_table: standard]
MQRRSVLVSISIESLKNLGLSHDQAADLLMAGLSPNARTDTADACGHFRQAAQKEGLLRSLATPNFRSQHRDQISVISTKNPCPEEVTLRKRWTKFCKQCVARRMK